MAVNKKIYSSFCAYLKAFQFFRRLFICGGKKKIVSFYQSEYYKIFHFNPFTVICLYLFNELFLHQYNREEEKIVYHASNHIYSSKSVLMRHFQLYFIVAFFFFFGFFQLLSLFSSRRSAFNSFYGQPFNGTRPIECS